MHDDKAAEGCRESMESSNKDLYMTRNQKICQQLIQSNADVRNMTHSLSTSFLLSLFLYFSQSLNLSLSHSLSHFYQVICLQEYWSGNDDLRNLYKSTLCGAKGAGYTLRELR
jgi:hypothetical protein